MHKSRLVFGIIKKILGVIFGTIYHILALFNLQITALLLLIGLVLFFTGVFESNPTFKVVYELLIIASIVLAIVTTVRKMLGLNKKKDKTVKRSKGAQIVENSNENAPIIPTNGYQYAQPTYQYAPPSYNEAPPIPQPPIYQEAVPPVVIPVEPEKPVYYRVKQNPDYVMAEYSDRYELYKITGGGLTKIRTDFK